MRALKMDSKALFEATTILHLTGEYSTKRIAAQSQDSFKRKQ